VACSFGRDLSALARWEPGQAEPGGEVPAVGEAFRRDAERQRQRGRDPSALARWEPAREPARADAGHGGQQPAERRGRVQRREPAVERGHPILGIDAVQREHVL
jgi:hypothetical protein